MFWISLKGTSNTVPPLINVKSVEVTEPVPFNESFIVTLPLESSLNTSDISELWFWGGIATPQKSSELNLFKNVNLSESNLWFFTL